MEFWIVVPLWAAVGWCGTGRIRGIRVLPPPPPPPWHPLVAMFGGAVVGFVTFWGLGLSMPLSSPDFIATSIGAYAGGRIFSDLYTRFFDKSPEGTPDVPG